MRLSDEPDWGRELAAIYSDEIEGNTEDELWTNQRFTGIEAPIDNELDNEIELSDWGREMANLYQSDL